MYFLINYLPLINCTLVIRPNNTANSDETDKIKRNKDLPSHPAVYSFISQRNHKQCMINVFVFLIYGIGSVAVSKFLIKIYF